MKRMAEAGVEPNVVSYCAMIDACSKAGDAARAGYWHEVMLERGVQPNAHSFSAVISACAKAHDVSAALHHLEAMEDQWKVPADVVVFSSVLDACAKVGDADRARAVFDLMRQRGVRPNVVAYASLARPFAHRGDWQEVEFIAQDMEAQGLRMNDYFLYAQLIAYANARPQREHARAERAFREACAKGVVPNKHVMSALTRAVGRVTCQSLLKDLEAQRVSIAKVPSVLRRPRRIPIAADTPKKFLAFGAEL